MPQKATISNKISYDPETGEFRHKSGKLAGWINSDGYRMIKIDNETYSGHRLAFYLMTGEWPEHHVDHENKIKNDNRWINLREATHSENMTNRPLKDGFRGVYKHGNKFKAVLKKDNIPHYLGLFPTKELAAKAWDCAALEFHGAFANLNFGRA